MDASLLSRIAPRFHAKVDRSDLDGCWPWTAARGNEDGYGVLYLPRDRQPKRPGRVAAHRLAWELTHGPIPEGLNVCHRCDNPPCCNPTHLFLGTQLDNMRDCAAKGRTSRASQNKGEHHGLAKLTWAAVAAIRSGAERGDLHRDIARRFGTSPANVSMIVNRKAWWPLP